MATGISIWHKLWLALITVNPIAAKDSKETALATIAGVAAALWAGSLISYQLKAPSLLRLNGLNLLQTAFFGATLALAIDAVELRFAAIVFGVYYGFFAVRDLRAARTLESFKKATLKRYHVVRTDEEWNRAFRDLRRYLYVMLVTVGVYFIVAKWPYHATVCWVGVVFLFGGYQVVLRCWEAAWIAVLAQPITLCKPNSLALSATWGLSLRH